MSLNMKMEVAALEAMTVGGPRHPAPYDADHEPQPPKESTRIRITPISQPPKTAITDRRR